MTKQTNPFADMFANFSQFSSGNQQFSQIFATQQKNLETLAKAQQTLIEGAQEIAAKTTELARSQMEESLKVSKELYSSKAPETNAAKQAEFAQSAIQSTISNMQQLGELASKKQMQAAELLNERIVAGMQELTQMSDNASKSSKKAA